MEFRRASSDKETLKYSPKAKATVRKRLLGITRIKERKKKGKETSRKLKPNVDGSRGQRERERELKEKRSDCVKKD